MSARGGGWKRDLNAAVDLAANLASNVFNDLSGLLHGVKSDEIEEINGPVSQGEIKVLVSTR